ncbi:MAG TPA: hypothetical protein VGN60_02840 [Devosia sp.]|jgi:hypothetical protein|nr:hypothetical protein [Devosia sp.]
MITIDLSRFSLLGDRRFTFNHIPRLSSVSLADISIMEPRK